MILTGSVDLAHRVRFELEAPCLPGSRLERATRIELACSAWEADVLPLNYARERLRIYRYPPRTGTSGLIGRATRRRRISFVCSTCAKWYHRGVGDVLNEVLAECIGDSPVSVSSRVLIDQGGAHSVVAHARHQIACWRAGSCGRIASMSKIVQVQMRPAQLGHDLFQCTVLLKLQPVRISVQEAQAQLTGRHEAESGTAISLPSG